MLAVLAALALAQFMDVGDPISPTLHHELPPVRFAAPGGVGMGTECSGGPITTSTGDVTVTRSTSGFCVKGNPRSGLTTSSMVLLGPNVPRVMRGGDGTGELGLLSEPVHKNWALWSCGFDTSATWVPTGTIAAAPTVTADQALAPDGTLTADRVQFPSVGAGGQSLLVQTTGKTSGNVSTGTFVRGVYDGGLPDGGADDGGTVMGAIFTYLTVNATPACRPCSYVSGSWTQCVQENQTLSSTGKLSIGLDVLNGCSGAIAAQDVYLWQADLQDTPNLYSSVPTTNAAVQYGADLATAPFIKGVGGLWCMAATVEEPSFTTTAGASNVTIHLNSSNRLRLNNLTVPSGVQDQRAIFQNTTIGGAAGTGNACATTAKFDGGSPARLAVWNDGVDAGCCVGGACNLVEPVATTMPTGIMKVSMGASANGAGFEIGAVIKDVQISDDPTFCRRAP